MRREIGWAFWLRPAIPLLVAILLGISPRPREAAFHLAAAQKAILSGQVHQAAVQLALAGERMPGQPEPWERAGRYALQSGDAPLAAAHLERAQKEGGLSAAGWLALGDAYSQSGRLDEALSAWAKVQPSSAGILERMAGVQRQQGDYAAAITTLQAQLALQPGQAELLFTLGLLAATQQPETALAYLAEAAVVDPSLAPPATRIREAVQSARRAGEPAYSLLAAGRALASLEEWELAGEAFRQAVLQRPDYAEAWALLAEARQHASPLGPADPHALAELQHALALDPRSLTANTLLALYWQRQGRHELAAGYLGQAAVIDPSNPVPLVELGSSLALLGELDAALQAYQQAAALASRQALYWRLLAGFCIKYNVNLRKTGLPAARQAVMLAPEDPDALDTQGQVLFLLGDLYGAQRFFERALQGAPDYPPALLHLGNVYLERGDQARARLSWQRAAELAQGTPAAEQALRLLQQYAP